MVALVYDALWAPPNTQVQCSKNAGRLWSNQGGLRVQLPSHVFRYGLQVLVLPREYEVIAMDQAADMSTLAEQAALRRLANGEAQLKDGTRAFSLPTCAASLVPHMAFLSFPHKCFSPSC